MKQVLVLGGSGGIGRACSGLFSEHPDYRVTISHRQKTAVLQSPPSICGDLCSPEFRRDLVRQTTPNVVIASFGTHPTEQSSMTEVINEYVLSVVELFEAFESKGGLEHFVVVSSLAAQTNVFPSIFMNSSMYKYICAKRMLSDFFRQAQLYRKSKSKIVLIEPGFVRTNFANINARLKNPDKNDIITRAQIDPIDPMVVAKAIFQTVSDPEKPSCSLTFYESAQRSTI